MTKPKFPSEKLDQYMVRFPDGLRDRIKAAAEANNRSMNAEIVAALLETYPDISGIDRSVDRAFERISQLIREANWTDLALDNVSEIVRRASLANNLDPQCFEISMTEGSIKLTFDHPSASRHSMTMVAPLITTFQKLMGQDEDSPDTNE